MSRHLILSGGPAHDFDATSRVLMDQLAEEGIESVLVTDPDDAFAMLRAAETGEDAPIDLFTVNTLRWRMETERYSYLRALQGFALRPDDGALMETYVRDGGGLLALHAAVICFDGDPTWRRLCGASWVWGSSSHPSVGPAEVRVTSPGRAHVLTEGLDDFVITDEIYGFLDQDDDLEPLLSASHGGREHPLLWARQVGAGRVVTDLLGHGVESLSHPAHRSILTRAASWASRGSVSSRRLED